MYLYNNLFQETYYKLTDFFFPEKKSKGSFHRGGNVGELGGGGGVNKRPLVCSIMKMFYYRLAVVLKINEGRKKEGDTLIIST